LSSSYGKITSRVVRATAIVLVFYVGLISLTGFQFSRMPTGFIPDQDIGYLAAVVQLPPGSSLARTDAIVREVNDIILETPGIEHTSPVAGFDVTTNTNAPNVGTIFLGLPSLYGHHIPGVNAATTLAVVRKRLAVIKDAFILVINPPPVQGLGAAGGFKMMVEDRNNLGPQALADATNALVGAANKDPAFGGVFTLYNVASPSLYVDINRLKAEKVGLTPTDVFSTLQLYLGSQYVNDFNYLGRTFQVLAQGDESFRKSPEDIAQLKVRNAGGEMVPIGSVASFNDETRPIACRAIISTPPPRSWALQHRASRQARPWSAWRFSPSKCSRPASRSSGLTLPISRSSRAYPPLRFSQPPPCSCSSCWRRSMRVGSCHWRSC
jgi:multidrug efflux pump subunit AcrB